jgi:hypothetical protein
MKEDRENRYSQIINLEESIYNDEFVKLINTLLDSIKEYYKVSKNITKNEKVLINSAEYGINNSQSIINKIINEEVDLNQINLYNKIIENLITTLNKLEININSSEKNLLYFFEDAKVLFRKMNLKRKEMIMNYQKRINSISNKKIGVSASNSSNKKNRYKMPNQSEIQSKLKNNLFMQNQKSEINCRISGKVLDGIFPYETKTLENNRNFNSNSINDVRIRQKARTYSKKINNKFEDSKMVNGDKNEDSALKGQYKGINNIEKYNNEELKMLVKKYEIQIKKLNIELKKYQMNDNRYTNYSTIQNDNQKKNKLILALKDNLRNSNIKYNELYSKLNDSQNKIKKLEEENLILKSSTTSLVNKSISFKDQEKNANKTLTIKLNNLIKENSILKKNIESLKYSNPVSLSDFNYRNSQQKNGYLIANQPLEKEVELLRKQLSDEMNKNKELLNKSISMKNKYNSEISQISKRNTELSKLLLNKQNALFKLEKDNLDKNKELANLKLSLNNLKQNSNIDQEKQKVIDSYKKNNSKGDINNNIIIENNKKEIEQLKNLNNTLQDKIKYYQTQIKNIKNELYEKIQENIELKNNTDKQMRDMKNDYENTIKELEEKNKELESNLGDCQNFNNNLNQQIDSLNQQIVAKDIKILELNYQNEQTQNKCSSLEEQNKKISEELNTKKTDNNKINEENQQISILKEELEQQKILSNDLNNELSKIKNDKQILTKKISNYENEILNNNKNNDINEEIKKKLNQEIENLKKENSSLKLNNEKLSNQLTDILSGNKKLNNINNEEKEQLKNQIFNMKTDKEKYDNEIKVLKRENEKMKDQIYRLSKSLPEEYNELQQQYNDLENKYKNLVKSKHDTIKIEQSPAAGSVSTGRKNDEKMEELNKAKKEIEQIKKKNMELVRQLEEKEFKKNCYDNKSEENVSNYEEEFDLRKMAKGAKDKNRSQDINIDYPGIQAIKEKYRELDFYYNSLEGLVKKLLLTIQCTPKNKTYVTELCKIVGFDLETTNKIITNRSKNLLLSLFNK